MKKVITLLLHVLCILYTHFETDEDAWLMPICIGDMTDKQGEAYLPGKYLR